MDGLPTGRVNGKRRFLLLEGGQAFFDIAERFLIEPGSATTAVTKLSIFVKAE
jgi:hypothetical protein